MRGYFCMHLVKACFVVVSLASLAQGQIGGWFNRVPTELLKIEAVRKEVNLTEGQYKDIQQVETLASQKLQIQNENFRARLRELADDAGPQEETKNEKRPGSAPLNERQQQYVESMRGETLRVMKESDSAYRKILKPEQTRRLLELYLRSTGSEAFDGPELARYLNIDPDKHLEIKQIIREARTSEQAATFQRVQEFKQRLAKRPDGTFDAEKHRELLTTDTNYRKQYDDDFAFFRSTNRQIENRLLKKILSVITRRQRETYIKLIGEPFDSENLIRERPPLPPGLAPKPPASQPATKPAAAKPEVPATKTLREKRGLPKESPPKH